MRTKITFNPIGPRAIIRGLLSHAIRCSVLAAVLVAIQSNSSPTGAQEMLSGADNFYKSDDVTARKVTFKNQYQMTIAGNLIVPKSVNPGTKNPAIIVGHPMGAVKEQSATLYANKMAERGFVTLAVDLSFWGESEGMARNAVEPAMFTETFMAAVDFLGTQSFVDPEKIGAIGVCGSGGFLISAAKIDPRLKAIATVSMYDMGAVTRNGYGKSRTVEQRKELLAKAAQLRYEEYTTGEQVFQNYLPFDLPKDADPVTAMYHDFYRTPRGLYVPEGRTAELTQNRTLAGDIKFMNFYPFNDIETISPRPLLFIAGDQAHSKEFSEDAYERASQPKELYWVEGANHVDLYDRVNVIPFEKLETFFNENLKN
ncbi:hypothetical protein CGZ80_00775 [Rhodopirellula sp. MGV]|nr:hypothetical protein CGZ80_18655 [Rhodopirellula sp. MGV]OYP39209.1 hypothetical protein CGZ80_00775 [Rhodopirellula sp. MGV]PNY35415.1 alpha/beta hydrolase [Rhodopirellula baltica]